MLGTSHVVLLLVLLECLSNNLKDFAQEENKFPASSSSRSVASDMSEARSA